MSIQKEKLNLGTIDAHGKLVIGKEIREEAGLKPGDKLVIFSVPNPLTGSNSKIIILKLEDIIDPEKIKKALPEIYKK